MFRPRVIPVLLLKNRGLVKTIKFENPTYVGDPMNAVRIFNDLEADELVFLDISASPDNRTIPFDFVKDIGDEAFMPFAVGGGIKTVEEIREIIRCGAEKVVINSAAIDTPDLVREAAETFGSQAVVVSLDVKETSEGHYEIHTYGGTKATGLDAVSVATQMEFLGAGEIMINSIDRDGTKEGYDIDLIRTVAEAVKIPVIALGGAGSWEDLPRAIRDGKASAVAAGTMFVFTGRKRAVLINYPDREEMEDFFRSIHQIGDT
jgi:cyclase